jgi:hypothetical protein
MKPFIPAFAATERLLSPTRRCVPHALTFIAALTLGGCAVATDDTQEDVASEDDPLLKKTAPNATWNYRGIMPALDMPQVVVSLAGHTVHVSGLLPQWYAQKLPYYAKTEIATGGRTRVHLVYPIATVDAYGTTADGMPTRNPEPATYTVCGGDNNHLSNNYGPFGGFPFIQYVCNHRDADGRVRDGIAFHGPITTTKVDGADYWFLKRGPVSHACNRMLGEHVLELAQVIGFARNARVAPPVKVIKDFDKLDGKLIDVDYPASGWTRPAASVATVFPTWQAVRVRADGTMELQFPQWACDSARCAAMPPNAYDAYTGLPLAKK